MSSLSEFCMLIQLSSVSNIVEGLHIGGTILAFIVNSVLISAVVTVFLIKHKDIFMFIKNMQDRTHYRKVQMNTKAFF